MIEFKPDDKIIETIKIIINKAPKDVKWCFWAGLATFFYGSNRKTTDIDIMIRKSDMQKFINSLNEFVVSYPKDTEKDIFRFVSTKLKMNNFEIEVASDVTIETEGKKYLFEFDEGMISKIRKIKINDIEIPTMSPEDVIVFKAICQRGIEKGKHDIEDIEGVLKNQKIDWKYLEERSSTTESYGRIFELLRKLGYKVIE